MEVEEAKLTNRSTQTGDTVGVGIGGREGTRGQGNRHGTQVVPRSLQFGSMLIVMTPFHFPRLVYVLFPVFQFLCSQMRDLIVVGPANWVIILDVDELITMRSSLVFLFPSLLFRNEGNIRNSASATKKRPIVCLGAGNLISSLGLGEI